MSIFPRCAGGESHRILAEADRIPCESLDGKNQGQSLLPIRVSDFEAEFDMALMNRKMAPHLESVYLMANQEHLLISATRIREVSRLGYDVADMVPPHVRTALRKKHGQE